MLRGARVERAHSKLGKICVARCEEGLCEDGSSLKVHRATLTGEFPIVEVPKKLRGAISKE